MGSGDADKSTNTEPPVSAAAAVGTSQEHAQAGSSIAATPAVYPDWSGFQAYPPMPPHGFYQHGSQSPYMWGPQHIMPPYATPPSPYVMYPHGVYAHPPMQLASHHFSPYAVPPPNGTDASGAVASGAEVDGKSSDGKEKSPIKRSKGSLGSLNMITGKGNNDMGKTSGASANEMSQSGESGSEGSSDGSNDNSQNESHLKTNGEKESCGTHQNGATAAHRSQNGVPTHPSSQGMLNHPMPIIMPATGIPAGVAGPTTALNIGMDYWGAPNATVASIHGKVPANSVGVTRENAPSELWPQDERELKRQRRKQSNRESARRSRLRKQAECEELAQRVEVLKEENVALRTEVDRIRKEYEQLLVQNTSLQERLGGIPRGTDDSRNGREGTHQTMDSNSGPQNGL